jgi:hypothetical protein
MGNTFMSDYGNLPTPDDWMQSVSPYVTMRHKETGERKRFPNTSVSDCFDILYARKTGWIYDSELSAQDSAEDGDDGQ